MLLLLTVFEGFFIEAATALRAVMHRAAIRITSDRVISAVKGADLEVIPKANFDAAYRRARTSRFASSGGRTRVLWSGPRWVKARSGHEDTGPQFSYERC